MKSHTQRLRLDRRLRSSICSNGVYTMQHQQQCHSLAEANDSDAKEVYDETPGPLRWTMHTNAAPNYRETRQLHSDGGYLTGTAEIQCLSYPMHTEQRTATRENNSRRSPPSSNTQDECRPRKGLPRRNRFDHSPVASKRRIRYTFMQQLHQIFH